VKEGLTTYLTDIDEQSTYPLEPHSILPSQFFRKPTWTGEQRLMAAILEDAVRTCQRGASSPSLLRKTLAWIESSDRRWVFSFLNICTVLALDSGRIRSALFRSLQRPAAQRRPVEEQPFRLAASG